VRMEVDVRSTDRILHARVQARQWYGGVRAARGGTKTYEHRAERCRSDEPSVLSAERSPLHIQSYRECHAVCFVCACCPRTFLPRNDGVSRVGKRQGGTLVPLRAALAGAYLTVFLFCSRCEICPLSSSEFSARAASARRLKFAVIVARETACRVRLKRSPRRSDSK